MDSPVATFDEGVCDEIRALDSFDTKSEAFLQTGLFPSACRS